MNRLNPLWVLLAPMSAACGWGLGGQLGIGIAMGLCIAALVFAEVIK